MRLRVRLMPGRTQPRSTTVRSGGSGVAPVRVGSDRQDWLALFRADLRRYRILRPEDSLFTLFATEQALWALLQYRLASAIYHSSVSWVLKRSALLVAVFWQKVVEITTGISLPYAATIGPGLYIGHYGTTILHPEVVLGQNCTLQQGAQIAISGRGAHRGVPKIGDRVYFGINAVALGNISIGDDVLIGSSSLVTRDVPAHCTVLGVPAQVVSDRGSEDYIVLDSRPDSISGRLPG